MVILPSLLADETVLPEESLTINPETSKLIWLDTTDEPSKCKVMIVSAFAEMTELLAALNNTTRYTSSDNVLKSVEKPDAPPTASTLVNETTPPGVTSISN